MEALPKKITKEIRGILEGIKSGTLAHRQDLYHRGTSHCVAGWKCVYDFARAQKDNDILNMDFDHDACVQLSDRLMNAINNDDEWLYAQKQWHLTEKESSALFNVRATLEQQFALLEKLEAGERIED